jgi:hypothetical protein
LNSKSRASSQLLRSGRQPMMPMQGSLLILSGSFNFKSKKERFFLANLPLENYESNKRKTKRVGRSRRRRSKEMLKNRESKNYNNRRKRRRNSNGVN